MSLARSILVALVAALGATPSFAQPSLVKKIDDWGVYSYASRGKERCYVLTMPRSLSPSNVNHGKNYLMVLRSRGEAAHWVPQAKFGYRIDAKAGVTARVGDKTFHMTPRGNTAWTLKESREGELVKAMRDGASLVVEATSARGTETRYVFSLDGVTAALKRAADCR
ncbi:MAG TPA: invasion associated locus B family protein [Shinella sp.]|jgi:hypothetical protein|nr:invasion associated locus B family protein [Shinella sp.]